MSSPDGSRGAPFRRREQPAAEPDLNFFRPGALDASRAGPSHAAAEGAQRPPAAPPDPAPPPQRKRYRPENDDTLYVLPPDPNSAKQADAPAAHRPPNAAARPPNEPAPLPARANPAAVLVSPTQRGNPVLDCVRNVPWEFSGDFPADYQLGRTCCALFLSLKYHRLHPEYLAGRVARLGRMYALRIVLVLVDVEDHEKHLREVHATCAAGGCTAVLAWSNEEAGRYLETFKAYENKGPDAIKARVEDGYLARLTGFLTSVKGVNKTDVVSLASSVGSLRSIIQAPKESLLAVPGFGDTKAGKLHAAFRQPFRIDRSGRARDRAAAEARDDAAGGPRAGSPDADGEGDGEEGVQPLGRDPSDEEGSSGEE
ncbi:restriction endonuclease type II-like protein [Hyaloraphidium curvatum]|nr:restriction endonuclease type II-like protein [Hyaloraphidium curvatum]